MRRHTFSLSFPFSKSIIAFLPLLFCCLCTQCRSERKQSNSEKVRNIQPLIITREVTDLEPYIEELELIPISSDSVSLSGIVKILVSSDHYFILSGGAVFSMPREGGSIEQIGSIGRGPGEYLFVKDVTFNSDETELWCLDPLNAILRYSIEDNSYLGDISIEKEIAHPKAIFPLANERVAVYVPNPLMEDMGDEDLSFYCLRILDKNGKEIDKDFLWDDYNIDAGFSSPVSFSDDGICVLSLESSRPCVVFQNGIEIEQIFFDFGRKNVPFRFSFLSGDDPMQMLSELFKEDYYKLVSYVFFSDNYLYFSAYGKNSSLWNYVICQDRSEGIRWRSAGLYTPPKSAIATEQGYFLFPYEDYGAIESVEEERDPIKKCVLARFGVPPSIQTCLIKVKFHV